MTSLATSVPKDLAEKSVLHLHAVAHAVLPISQSLSSYLASSLLATASENEVNLPKPYIDSRICQRCGTIYLPGVTCSVITVQSRRQKRKEKGLTWVIYRCKACKMQYRTEIEIPKATSLDVRKPMSIGKTEEKQADITPASASQVRKRRKRERLQGLKSAVEKSKAERTTVQLDLIDLMKID